MAASSLWLSRKLRPSTPLSLQVGAYGGHGRRRSLLGRHNLLILDPATKRNVALDQVRQRRVDGAVRARNGERKLFLRQLEAEVDQPQGRPDVVANDHAEMVHPEREHAARARLPDHSSPRTGDIHSTSFPSGSST